MGAVGGVPWCEVLALCVLCAHVLENAREGSIWPHRAPSPESSVGALVALALDGAVPLGSRLPRSLAARTTLLLGHVWCGGDVLAQNPFGDQRADPLPSTTAAGLQECVHKVAHTYVPAALPTCLKRALDAANGDAQTIQRAIEHGGSVHVAWWKPSAAARASASLRHALQCIDDESKPPHPLGIRQGR